MDLRSKISYGAIFVLIMLLVGGLGAFMTARRQAESAVAVRHTDAVLDTLDTTLRLVIDVETGARGYALTGRSEFLEPNLAARRQLPSTLARLNDLAGETPARRAQLAELDRLIASRVAVAEDDINVRRTQGLKAASSTIAAAHGKALTDRIRDLIDQLRQEEQDLLVARSEADHAASLRNYRLLLALFGASMALVLIATALLRRGIGVPTERVLDGLERLAAGDLQAHVDPLANDELGRIATTFNETVVQRRRSEEALAHANALLDGLFRASPLGIVAIDKDGHVELWNPAAEKIFGWPAAEVKGRPLAVIPADEQRSFEELRRRVMVDRETVSSVETMRLRRDGSVFHACVSAAPLLRDGVLIGMMAVVEDITARKTIEAELRESEERFRLALDEAPIGMALVGLDGRFLRVNNVLCEIVGYSREELTATTFQRITHPEDLDTDVALAQKLAAGEIPRYQLGKRYLRKDGSVVDILLSGSVVRAPDGAPLYYIAQIEDVTERKRMEEALRRSAAEFRGLIDSLPDGVYLSRGRHVVYANQALASLLGVNDPEALIGMVTTELYHPYDRAVADERLSLLEENQPARPRELRLLRQDGSPVAVESTGIEVRFEEQPTSLMIVRDLTERKRAERQRDEAFQRLRVIVELAPVGIVLSDDGRRWVGNRRAEQLFGRQIDWSVDISEYGESLLDADEHTIPFERLPGVRALAGETLEAVEMRLRRPDGVVKPVLVNAAPIPDESGGRAGAVVAFEDISSLKELERLRIEWSALIAHDLRQPLSSIDMYAQLVAEQVAENPMLQKRVLHIRSLARRLNRMIEDLLDFSRLEARQLTLHRRRVDLVDVVREAAERIALEAPDRPIQVRVAGPVGPVDIDVDRIAQVMDNLLSNAIKYGDRDSPILVEIEPGVDAVSVSVSNRGPGIAPEQMPGLFARFRRAEDAKRRGIRGIGLGLYITRELIEAHQGQISVVSTPSKTTTFRFTLPTATAAQQVAGPAPQAT